jgi:hypothetical protein
MTPRYAIDKFREVAEECATSQRPLQERLASALQKLSTLQDTCFPAALRPRWNDTMEAIRGSANMELRPPGIACSDAESRRLLGDLLSIGAALERWVAVDEFVLHSRR